MDVRVGARFRALRHRRGWRQADLARRAGVSKSVVSLVECGQLERVSLAKLRSIARALDSDFLVQLRWRGGDFDRLLDEGHASLVGAVAKLLKTAGWQFRFEVSYAVYAERGSIDVLAWHPETRTLLVVEVKTELTSVEETLRKHDEKMRLANRIAEQQFGWTSSSTARLLVLANLSTPRRRVERHRTVLDSAYQMRGLNARRWLGSPSGSTSGLLFLDTPGGARRPGTVSRKRISAVRPAV